MLGCWPTQQQNMKLLTLLSAITAISLTGFPALADTNCWYPQFRNKFDRSLLSSDRCGEKPIFRLVPGEVSRNIRSSPNSLRILGKMSETGNYSLFESDLIVTYDDGKTYWAWGTAFSDESRNKINGWVEVGNTSAITQYDRPGINDVWYKF